MSTDLGFIRGRVHADPDQQGSGLRDGVAVTRFAGGREDGVCVQLTIGDKFAQLDEVGVLDLLDALGRR
jgi:hypothetical protein